MNFYDKEEQMYDPRSEQVGFRGQERGRDTDTVAKTTDSPSAMAIQRLIEQIRRAEKLGDCYNQALTPVLGQERPVGENMTGKDAGHRQSPLVEAIDEQVARLRGCLDGFENLLSRVEL